MSQNSPRNHRQLTKRSVSKRYLDALSNRGFTGFDKRAFDPISDAGFTGFDKWLQDYTVENELKKRAVDALTARGFTVFDKRMLLFVR